MKKLIYKGLYEATSLMSNRFNIRLLTKLKLYLGIALLVIVGSCSKNDDEKNNGELAPEPQIMCYDVAEPPQESTKTES